MSPDLAALYEAIQFLEQQLVLLCWEPAPVWDRVWRAKKHLETQLATLLRQEA